MRLIVKAKRMPIGTVSHGRKKVAEGKWVRVKIERTKSGLLENLSKAEDSIINLKYEKCFVFDSDGKQVFEKSGDASEIVFTKGEMATYFTPGAIFTHNHPMPVSFSPMDLKMAFVKKFGEMRVVSEDAVYSAKFDSKWTDPDWVAFADAVDQTNYIVKKVSYEKIGNGDLTPKDAGLQHWHLVWTMLSSIDGFEYSRREKVK